MKIDDSLMMEDAAKYYASRNEQISTALNPSVCSAFKAKPKIKHVQLADGVQEANQRKLENLKEGGKALCEEFEEKHRDISIVADEIESIFGKSILLIFFLALLIDSYSTCGRRNFSTYFALSIHIFTLYKRFSILHLRLQLLSSLVTLIMD